MNQSPPTVQPVMFLIGITFKPVKRSTPALLCTPGKSSLYSFRDPSVSHENETNILSYKSLKGLGRNELTVAI